jgi:hypothetical protein
MAASASSSASASLNLFTPLLMPLQSLVDFFSPPVQRAEPGPVAIGMQPRLAKAPALPQSARPPARASLQPAGIRLVGQGLMGNIGQRAAAQPLSAAAADSSAAAQILRSRRAQDGRIVISGRMRDVCAELDRLCDDTATVV